MILRHQRRERPLLLTGDPGWAAASRELADPRAPLKVVSPNGAWQARVGVGRDGALLVRPDGFVAWRATEGPSASTAELSRVLNTVLANDRREPIRP